MSETDISARFIIFLKLSKLMSEYKVLYNLIYKPVRSTYNGNLQIQESFPWLNYLFYNIIDQHRTYII